MTPVNNDPTSKPTPDYPEFEQLRGVDLSKLDLDHIELDIERPSRFFLRFLFGTIALIALIALVLWLPNSSIYHNYGQQSWLFFAICIAAIIIGVAGGRWLWAWLEHISYVFQPHSMEERKPLLSLRQKRLLLLTLTVFGVVLVAIILPRDSFGQGTEYAELIWFGASVGAIVIGVLGGRWIWMQAEASPKNQPRNTTKISLPSWFKWLSLSVIVIVGLIALVVPYMVRGTENERTVSFAMSTVGLIFSVLICIWIARRFDEREQKSKQPSSHQTQIPRTQSETQKFGARTRKAGEHLQAVQLPFRSSSKPESLARNESEIRFRDRRFIPD